MQAQGISIVITGLTGTFRRRLALFALASLTAVACAATFGAVSAAANGGSASVESAPLISSGQTVSGDTASGPVISHGLPDGSCAEDVELWKLDVTAGDTVLLKGAVTAPAENFEVAAMPPGVTNARLAESSEIAGSHHESLEHDLTFAAERTGTWLVAVGSCYGSADGPYQLTATVEAGKFACPAGGGEAHGGGSSVAAAPLLTSGVRACGNTAEDAVIAHSLPDGSCSEDVELWKLNVNAGDRVLLQGSVEAPSENFEVAAMPPGVTDATLAGSGEISGSLHESLEHGLAFAASKTGTWLIAVGGCYGSADGPYQLTAKVEPGLFVPGAGGGTTVETAPLIASGQTVSGNTAADAVVSVYDGMCAEHEELWKLNVTAGDRILLNGRVEAPAEGFEVAAMPPGVTDATLASRSEIAGSVHDSLENGLSFAAAKSGTWLIAVGSCGNHDGPYQLKATVSSPRPRCTTCKTCGTTCHPPKIMSAGFLSHSETAKAGERLRLKLSEAATATVTIKQIVHGRLHRGHCNAHARHGHRCTLTVQRRTVPLHGVKGAKVYKLGLHGLKPGSYVAIIVARNADGKSGPRTLHFTIKPPKRHGRRLAPRGHRGRRRSHAHRR